MRTARWPLVALARLYFDLGDDSKVFERTGNAAKRWPDDPLIQLQLAFVNLIRRDAAGAVRHAQRAFEVNPRLNLPLSILRNADMQNGRYDAALARYEQAYPELFVQRGPSIHAANYRVAIDLALVLQKRGESEAANVLLDGAARVIRTIPRLGVSGYWVSDVAIHALRGQKAQALAALRDAEKAGWRGPVVALLPRYRPQPRLDPQRARIQSRLRRHRARHGATTRPPRRATEGRAA